MKLTIKPKRLRSLLLDEQKLRALEAGGVDDWDWYSDSLIDHGYFAFEEKLDEVSDKNLFEHI